MLRHKSKREGEGYWKAVCRGLALCFALVARRRRVTSTNKWEALALSLCLESERRGRERNCLLVPLRKRASEGEREEREKGRKGREEAKDRRTSLETSSLMALTHTGSGCLSRFPSLSLAFSHTKVLDINRHLVRKGASGESGCTRPLTLSLCDQTATRKQESERERERGGRDGRPAGESGGKRERYLGQIMEAERQVTAAGERESKSTGGGGERNNAAASACLRLSAAEHVCVCACRHMQATRCMKNRRSDLRRRAPAATAPSLSSCLVYTACLHTPCSSQQSCLMRQASSPGSSLAIPRSHACQRELPSRL